MNPLNYLVAVVIASAFSASNCVAQDTPPETFTLPVKLHAQETELWCWAATGEMTMEFLGRKVTQAEQANLFLKRTDCSENPIPRPCVRSGEFLLTPFGFTFDQVKTPPTQKEIVHQVYELRKPVPFSINWSGGGGHGSVIVGYLNDAAGKFFLEVLDPYPPPGKSAKNKKGGNRSLVLYDRWAGDHYHKLNYALINVAKSASDAPVKP